MPMCINITSAKYQCYASMTFNVYRFDLLFPESFTRKKGLAENSFTPHISSFHFLPSGYYTISSIHKFQALYTGPLHAVIKYLFLSRFPYFIIISVVGQVKVLFKDFSK